MLRRDGKQPDSNSPRMRRFIDFHQPRRVDSRVGLRGRERRVTKKVLNRAKISAGIQKMCRKAVAHGMRRCARRKTKLRANRCHQFLDLARAEGAAANPAKDRFVPADLERTGINVGCHGLPRDRNDRNQAFLPALAPNAKGLAKREVRALQSERFRDSKPAAVEKQCNRVIPERDPWCLGMFPDGLKQ